MFKSLPTDLKEQEKQARLARAQAGRKMLRELNDFFQAHEAEYRQQCLDSGCAPERVDEVLQQVHWSIQVKAMRKLDEIVRERVLEDAAAASKVAGVEDVGRSSKP